MNLRPLLTLSILLLISSCSLKKEKGSMKGESADSIASLMKYTSENDAELALALIDSLEEAKAISENMANAQRTHIYFDRQQYRTAEFYGAKALKDNLLRDENRDEYYKLFRYLCGMAYDNGDNKKGLDYATRGLAETRTDNSPNARLYEAQLLAKIGLGQMRIGRTQEGIASCETSFTLFRDILDNNNQWSEAYMWYSSVGEAIQHMSVCDVQTAIDWLPRLEQTYANAIETPDIPPTMNDYCKARLELTKAEVYTKSGNYAKGEQHFRAYQQTELAQSGDDWVSPLIYFENRREWHNVHAIYARWDSLMQASQQPMNREYQQMLGMMFKAEMEMGQQQQALGTAQRIITNLNVVDSLNYSDDAAQLAVIYETQEKDAKIAEQQASLSRQRIIAVAVALALAVLFLVVFMIHRHRAALKLEEKNRELEQKNAELTLANERAEESSRMKTNFIQQISHEIRTPLNILSGFTQVVTMTGMTLDDATKQDINQRIMENTDRITGLVNKMLELSEASSQTVIERDDEVSAVQVAAQAVEESGISQATHIDFDMQMGDGADSIMLKTNLRSATRALVLLLDNAQKFTRKAEAHHRDDAVDKKESVVLRLEKADSMISLSVEDTGIGVPATEAEHIFEEFVQLDEYYDGTGIGLTVARNIARRLGGDIMLDTSYTTGARFVMTLPVEEQKT